jgi:hypothetical protein
MKTTTLVEYRGRDVDSWIYRRQGELHSKQQVEQSSHLPVAAVLSSELEQD